MHRSGAQRGAQRLADDRLGIVAFVRGFFCKPCGFDRLVTELLQCRDRLVLRRARPRSEPMEQLEAGGLTVDVARRQVVLDGEARELRPKEFDLLVEMMRQPGRVFTRDYLLERIWGYEYIGDGATVDVHVWRLRSKLGETRKNARFIHTVWGVGYSFGVNDDGP